MTAIRLPPSHRHALETLEGGGWLEIDEVRVRALTVSDYEGGVRLPRHAGAVVKDRNDYGRRITTIAWHRMRDMKWIIKRNGSFTHSKWNISAVGRHRLNFWREHGGGRRGIRTGGFQIVKRDAKFSPCRKWRYTLERDFNRGRGRCLFVLLNPSTADEKNDDPTNRRGMAFAYRWGFGSCIFVNLFAYRSKDPRALKTVDDPVGPDNNRHIYEQAKMADRIVLAWGVNGAFQDRGADVLMLLDAWPLYRLGLTKDRHPAHPLYLKANTRAVLWSKRK